MKYGGKDAEMAVAGDSEQALRLKELLYQIASDNNFKIEECNSDLDHIAISIETELKASRKRVKASRFSARFQLVSKRNAYIHLLVSCSPQHYLPNMIN